MMIVKAFKPRLEQTGVRAGVLPTRLERNIHILSKKTPARLAAHLSLH